MNTIILIVVAVLALSALSIVTLRSIRVYLKLRGKRLVTCPETRETAAVEVDATHAAFTAPTGERSLRLKECTRWPERKDCGQQCLAQIEEAPEDCLVRTILTHWYQGKECVFCGNRFGEIHWHDHKPALLSPERLIVEWSEVPPEQIPQVLASHKPVCWNCEIIETFLRRYPELVVNRPWRPGESHRSM